MNGSISIIYFIIVLAIISSSKLKLIFLFSLSYQQNVYESIFNNLKKNKKILINDKIVLNTSKIIDKIENL